MARSTSAEWQSLTEAAGSDCTTACLVAIRLCHSILREPQLGTLSKWTDESLDERRHAGESHEEGDESSRRNEKGSWSDGLQFEGFLGFVAR